MATYTVPPERRPKRIRSMRLSGRVGRPDVVVTYHDGTTAVLTWKEALAESKARVEGRGLRS